MEYTLGEIAQRIGARLEGDATIRISGVSSLESPRPDSISFITHPRYYKQLRNTSAAAVILRQDDLEHCPVAALVCDNPYATYARLTALFAPSVDDAEAMHPTAVIDPTATLGEGVRVGAHAVIGAGVKIGAGSRLYPNVTIYHDCEIGRMPLFIVVR